MRYVRRLIAILTGCATWCIAAATVAFAQVAPDPPDGVISPPATTAAETPVWQFIGTAALGVLLALAVVGLIYSLRHTRRAGATQGADMSHGAHA